MKKRILIYSLTLVIISGVTSCKRNQYQVDVSGIDLSVKIKRLENDLFSVSPVQVKNNIPDLEQKYGKFLQLFSYVINIGQPGDSTWKEGLVSFCTDKMNNEVYTAVSTTFPVLDKVEEGLTGAFRHYKHYFPGKPVPEIFTCISGFNNSIITLRDTILGISLDRYLGADCKYYPGLQIYKYQAARMNPFNIVPDCMYGWASAEWDYKEMNYSPENVLSAMIHEGKLLYFVKCMLPSENDNLIFGFTTEQMKFCEKNEGEMWQYLIGNRLLFSTAQLDKRKLTGEAPFTPYFSKESPGRAAVWTGFRIIESYMRNNKEVTLSEMMANTDCQSILEGAKYNPK